jgi:CheY-like chemotaxis protein
MESTRNDAQPSRRRAFPSHGGRTTTDAPTGPGILVADDEAQVRALLKDALQMQGFRAWLAADGEEALEIFRQHQEAIVLAILDVRMPRRNGPETLTALRALKPGLKACFVSGHTGQYNDDELLALGAAAVISKPFRLSDLVRLVKDLTVAR